MELDTIVCSDALEFMRGLPDASVDAIITDLPYGTTACSWDEIIPFEPMWAAVKRVLKPRGAFVTTASQPFTSKLIMSNLDWFKYSWVWVKSRPFDFFNARNKPLKKHEDIVVFSQGTTANGSNQRMTYNPQGIQKVDKHWKRPRVYESEHAINRPSHSLNRIIEFEGYPDTVLYFENNNQSSLHPTQKPVELFEYLIRTYTQPGEIVLDFCCGSGTTPLAARNTGRHWLACDLSPEYVQIALDRLAQPYTPPLFTADPAPADPPAQPALL